MKLLNPIRISYKNLLSAKVRSFLTILGIIIGVASVIIIMSIGQSAQRLILDQVSGVGSNLIGILPGNTDEDDPPAAAMGIVVTTLKHDDLEALQKPNNVPELEDAAGYVMGTATVEYENASMAKSFTGTTAGYIKVENAEIEFGRFITTEEEKNLAKVAVLGVTVAKDIFSEEDPLGKVIRIKDQNFTVIGVFKKRGSSGFGTGSQDDTVFVPVRTAQKLLLGTDHLGFIRAKAKDSSLISSAIANIKTTLRERHNIDDPTKDDFSVRDQASAVTLVTNITNVLRYFLLAIGTISLIVGGVGIMNTMLIVVNQRIREVGLRKAIGARNSDILNQFLVESAAISFLGGIIGITLGIGVSYAVSKIVPLFGYDWQFIISPDSIVVAVGVSILIGIFFGMYPARKASRVSPMEALRYE